MVLPPHLKFDIRHSEFPPPAWLSSDSSSFVNCRAHLPHESASLSVGPISKEESGLKNP